MRELHVNAGISFNCRVIKLKLNVKLILRIDADIYWDLKIHKRK